MNARFYLAYDFKIIFGVKTSIFCHKYATLLWAYFNVTCNRKGVRALRGYFGPLWSQKLKIAFHHFFSIDLLEE